MLLLFLYCYALLFFVGWTRMCKYWPFLDTDGKSSTVVLLPMWNDVEESLDVIWKWFACKRLYLTLFVDQLWTHSYCVLSLEIVILICYCFVKFDYFYASNASWCTDQMRWWKQRSKDWNAMMQLKHLDTRIISCYKRATWTVRNTIWNCILADSKPGYVGIDIDYVIESGVTDMPIRFRTVTYILLMVEVQIAQVW